MSAGQGEERHKDALRSSCGQSCRVLWIEELEFDGGGWEV